MDAERLLGNLLGGTLGRTFGRRGSSIFRGGSLTSKAQLGVGLLGLAMAAFEHYQKQSSAATPTSSGASPPPPPRSPSPPPPPLSTVPPPPPQAMQQQADAIVMIRAMIAAAQSDGRIDDGERSRIAQSTTGLSGEERAFLDGELAAPKSIADIARASRPEIAADVYAAAAQAIVPDEDAERAWLAELGAALQIDPSLRQRIDEESAAR